MAPYSEGPIRQKARSSAGSVPELALSGEPQRRDDRAVSYLGTGSQKLYSHPAQRQSAGRILRV